MKRIGGSSLGTEDKKILLIYTILRDEERIIDKALSRRGIKVEKVLGNRTLWELGNGVPGARLAINRTLSASQATYISFLLEDRGVKVINPFRTMVVCNDKALTTELLAKEGIPVPRTYLAFTPEKALEALEEIGYPAVIKPVNGSWGRLLAKVNDRDAAEAIIFCRWNLGGVHQKAFYIQEYVRKPGRDIRVLVIGGKVKYAVYRSSSHWVTNTARGAKAALCSVSDELIRISEKVASIVGGDFIALDLFESERGLLVNEVNSTPEFARSSRDVGIDVGEMIADYVEEVLS
ncbi:MAG: lysine biosynthesis protein LysX [Synergistetes bacterium]|nr:lysine biosynthesis protein LysX [Synergistota bacterium]MCX8128390.1 lysine biosynthesis protein LysX [Synergistota bacterium]MDW8192426.1 lysine biosynthesis protein LysX [Synergistota bacterium]